MERMKIRTWRAFNLWAIDMYNCSLKSNRYRILSNKNDFVVMTDTKRADKFGWAKKMPDDQWDERIGIGIAYARLKGIPIPKVVEYKRVDLDQLVNGDKFYVAGYTSLKEYYFVGYDCVNDSYVAVEPENGIRREFDSSECGCYFVEKEN